MSSLIHTCIICKERVTHELVQKFAEYSVIECPHCQYAYVDPTPTPEELTRLYNSKEYFDTHMSYNFDTITEEEINKRVKGQQVLHQHIIGNYLPQGGSLLEIGSGGGFALKALKNLGMKVKGLDTSKPAKEFAQKKFDIEVINIPFEEYETEEKFDVVFLNHVLEHFIDPVDAMNKIVSLLKNNGILYIRVPDHDSYDRKAYGKNWPAYAHYHISNFSEKSLQILFDNNRVSVLEVKKFLSDKVNPLFARLIQKTPFKSYAVRSYNGRTITMIGKKM